MKNSVFVNKDVFSRLFVLCKNQMFHLKSFTYLLAEHDEITLTEGYDNVPSIVELFNEITGLYVKDDTTFGIYNDAYWCGTVYFYLFFATKKPLSYILYKFPLDELIDCYNPYHEMDYSAIKELFEEKEKDNTILKLLCKQYGAKLTKLARETGISVNTLKRYYRSDDMLYTASFQNIYKISKYFDVGLSLFVKNT